MRNQNKISNEEFDNIVRDIQDLLSKKCGGAVVFEDLAEILLTVLCHGTMSMFVSEKVTDESERLATRLYILAMFGKIWEVDIETLDKNFEKLTEKMEQFRKEGKIPDTRKETESLVSEFENLDASKQEMLDLFSKMGWEPPKQ